MKTKIQKRTSVLLFCLLMVLSSRGQGLRIGDTLPDIVVGDVLNYRSDSLRLSDMRGKVVVLDFWGTNCKSCIDGFPGLDSVQRALEGKVQVILVNSSTKDSTLNFFRKRKKIPMPRVPMVTGDVQLATLFPHRLKPHHVWIDGRGVVRQVTSYWNTRTDHLQAFLRDDTVKGLVKSDVLDFDPSKPLIAEGNGRWLPKVEYFSYFMHAVPGASAGNAVHRTVGKGAPNYLSRNMHSVEELYRFAYGEGGKYNFDPQNTVMLDVKDPVRYRRPVDRVLQEAWGREHLWNYQLQLPLSQAGRLFAYMQGDLERFFGAVGVIERRKIPCLVLVRTAKEDRLRTKGGPPGTNFFIPNEDSIQYLRNRPYYSFRNKLKALWDNHIGSMPFVDETGYDAHQLIDIELPADVLEGWHGETLNKELERYGLKLVEKKRTRNVLVVKEKE